MLARARAVGEIYQATAAWRAAVPMLALSCSSLDCAKPWERAARALARWVFALCRSTKATLVNTPMTRISTPGDGNGPALSAAGRPPAGSYEGGLIGRDGGQFSR